MPALHNDFASLALQRPDAARRRVHIVCLCLSVVLHGGALAAVLMLNEPTDAGAVSNPSQAISVEIVASTVLEALQQPQAEDQPAAREAAARNAGETAPEQAAESEPKQEVAAAETQIKETAPQHADAAEHDKARTLPEEPAPVLVAPPPETKPDGADAAASAESEAARAREAADVARREAEKREDEQRREARRRDDERRKHSTQEGGATAKSSTAGNGSPSRASASTGSMLTYAARVRARVASHKPTGVGTQGTAVVSFAVTASGGLSHASVARSSGNAALDRLALAAVRGAAPFPAPPTGATARQLSFSIPFHFQ